MCLAVPGKVLEIRRETTVRSWPTSASAGSRRRSAWSGSPKPRIGDYVVVHVGFAISRMDETEALETLRILKEMGDLADEFAVDPPPPPESA